MSAQFQYLIQVFLTLFGIYFLSWLFVNQAKSADSVAALACSQRSPGPGQRAAVVCLIYASVSLAVGQPQYTPTCLPFISGHMQMIYV